MTASPPEKRDENYRQGDCIDRLCDEFEERLRCGPPPKIEDFLDAAPEEVRRGLLKELVALELEILGHPNDSVTFAAYGSRFPGAISVLESLRAERDFHRGLDQFGRKNSSAAPRGESAVSPPGGRRFRHFELKEVIGKGAFGIVWQAWDVRLQRNVALKFPRHDQASPYDQSIFLREARVVAQLRHPNIVPVFEVNDEAQEFYIASELVDGSTLKAYLAENKPSPREAALLVAKMATALEHAHSLEIIHRDLKPANVIIDRHGEPHITDFGLAKRDEGEEPFSAAGNIIGTPAYMSPEQTRGDVSLDCRTDIYSLGVVLYEMLTGAVPFRGDLLDVVQQIRETPPVPPRSIRADIPKDLEAICLKCLEKDPAGRYASAAALAGDLRRFLDGEALVGIPATRRERMSKWLRRHRSSTMATAAALLMALGWAGSHAWIDGSSPPSPEIRRVLFETFPPGCEITAVAINPTTGDPDPERIYSSQDRTPLTVDLPPGDYLVVAVLDDGCFHEVYRHVPTQDERLANGRPHLYWHALPDGMLKLRPIRIPTWDVSESMTFVSGAERLQEPLAAKGATPQAWRLPAFYVDPHEVSADELAQWSSEGDDEPSSQLQLGTVNFDRCVAILERQGRRPPTAAELYYLSSQVCSAAPCNGVGIDGLHGGVWEWTTTRPGGPFSGSLPLPGGFQDISPMRMIGAGPGESTAAKSVSGLLSCEEIKNFSAGIRGIRSVRPRRSASDFLSPAEPPSTSSAGLPDHSDNAYPSDDAALRKSLLPDGVIRQQ